MSGKGWKDPSNIIAAVACTVSVIAMFISVRSCAVADRSYEMSLAEFRSQRSIVLGGIASKDNDYIEIKPLDPTTSLQEAKAIFPSEVNEQEWPIQPPDHRLYTVMLSSGLRKIIESQVKRNPGHVSFIPDANIPLVISSLYTAKGQSREDVSLYRVMYSFMLIGDSMESPTIEFKGLIFVQHIEEKIDTRKFLNKIWSTSKGTPTPTKDGN